MSRTRKPAFACYKYYNKSNATAILVTNNKNLVTLFHICYNFTIPNAKFETKTNDEIRLSSSPSRACPNNCCYAKCKTFLIRPRPI